MIRIAEIEDLDKIMSFIDLEWRKDHILSRDKNFFMYEHGASNQINFVISKDDSGQINAVLGFIKASADTDADIWPVLWKVAKGAGSPMLGIELLEFLRNTKARSLMSAGINTATIGIYNFLGIQTDVMKHYVLRNYKLAETKIAQFSSDIKECPVIAKDCADLLLLKEKDTEYFNFEKYKGLAPYKDRQYFIKRYFKHPIYKYQVYGIGKAQEIQTLLVLREVLVGEDKVLRMVDMIGPEKSILNVRNALKNLIENTGYEYLDFVCYGFDHDILSAAGFFKVDLDRKDTIVPNYFSPYIKDNVKIYFYADVRDGAPFRIVKADGDQDRPS